MATWIAHLRIAELLARRYPELDDERFYIGNIGPDCGVPNEDWSAFTPDKAVSHWSASGTIDAEGFARAHLVGEPQGPRRLFFLGYWTHLAVDLLWKDLYDRKKRDPAWAPLATDKRFIWTIKEDWYGLDALHVRDHPDGVFQRRFAPVTEFPNVYLDYYPADAFTRQIRYITGFYQGYDRPLDRPFPFLSKEEMDDFVSRSADGLSEAVGAFQR